MHTGAPDRYIRGMVPSSLQYPLYTYIQLVGLLWIPKFSVLKPTSGWMHVYCKLANQVVDKYV